jgi:hypothetical protein
MIKSQLSHKKKEPDQTTRPPRGKNPVFLELEARTFAKVLVKETLKGLCLLDRHGKRHGVARVTTHITLCTNREGVRTSLLGGGVAIDSEAKALRGL